MKISERTIILVLPLITLAACGGSQPPSQTPLEPAPEYQTPAAAPVQETPLPEPAKAEPTPAIAEPLPEPPKTLELTFQPKSGSKLSGKAIVAETTDGVKITLALENVKPSDHGAHVHEKDDCSNIEGMSMGSQLGVQALGVAATVVWSALATLLIVLAVKPLLGLRATDIQIEDGLDLTQHGERAYTP